MHASREDTDVDRKQRMVLVEGISDQVALEALAERRGRNLEAEGVSVVPIGGAQSIGRFLDRFGPLGLDVTLAGLCDAAEEGEFRRALERAGLGAALTRADMERLGFYVCVVDLEDELIRALGTDTVVDVVAREGELGLLHTFQQQPAQRDRSLHEQLHRFCSTKSGRKVRLAGALAAELALDALPAPLLGVLTFAAAGRGGRATARRETR
jgi:hypothetical protein